MSGSTIGGVLGAAVGYWVGGARGAQVGWMIGSAVGGYVDPDVIPGQRMTDAQSQTVAEGAPRPIIKGTVRVAGNVIHAGPLDEHRQENSVGKGSGQVQESFTYTRTFAIRVVGHEIGNYSRIWADDKLVYDVRDPAQWPSTDNVTAIAISRLMGDTAKFASHITLYKGDELQLPDPSLEALPAEYGGGVGEVCAHRGTAYVVFTDYPCPNGSIPQFAFEVSECGDATTTETVVPWVHGNTGNTQSVFAIATRGLLGFVAGWNDNFIRTVDGGRSWNAIDYITMLGWGAGEPIEAIWHVEDTTTEGIWYIAKDDKVAVSYGGGGFWAEYLTPVHTIVGRIGEGGGVHFINGQHLAGANDTVNTVIFDPLILGDTDIDLGANFGRATAIGDLGGAVLVGTDIGKIVTVAGTVRYTDASARAIVKFVYGNGVCIAVLAGGGDYLWSNDMFTTTTVISGVVMHSACYARGKFYRHSVTALESSVDGLAWEEVDDYFSSNTDSGMITTDSFSILAVETASGKTATMPSAYLIPDMATGWHLDAYGNVVGDSTTAVDRCVAQLDDVVLDFLDMVGLTASQVDVSSLAGIDVRGFVVGQQMPAAEALRELQKFYLFDLAEWGDSGETSTKLRAILRGGPVLFDITNDNLLASDESQDTRPQAIEFARKLNLVTSDIDSDYNPTKQTAERRTDNIRAVGEASFTLSVVTIRTEAAPKADILLKVQWEQALGRTRFMLPWEYAALTPTDILTNAGKRWRAERCEYVDGTVGVDAVRDRAHAYLSNALPGDAPAPSIPPSTLRGPTEFAALNLPALRSSETTPGMQIGVCGWLDGWIGCDLYLSVDGGVSEQLVATYLSETTMGSLAANCDSGATDLITAKIIHGHELDSVTDAQIAARANAFVIASGSATGIAVEIGQFKTATETATPGTYDLTDLTRGELDTIPAAHYAGDRFVMLDSLNFLPISAEHAGKTLIFRPVSRGTVPANNRTYSVVYAPLFTGPATIDFRVTESGDIRITESGDYRLVD